MVALGGGGVLYEMCKKAMITKNYKVKDSMIAKFVKTIEMANKSQSLGVGHKSKNLEFAHQSKN